MRDLIKYNNKYLSRRATSKYQARTVAR